MIDRRQFLKISLPVTAGVVATGALATDSLGDIDETDLERLRRAMRDAVDILQAALPAGATLGGIYWGGAKGSEKLGAWGLTGDEQLNFHDHPGRSEITFT